MGSRAESHELNTLLNEEYHNPDSTPKAEALRVSDNSKVPIIAQRPAPAKLFRRTYLLFLVSLYSCLSMIAWTIICVQTHRPITTHTYNYQSTVDDVYGVLAKRMKSNAEWFRAAKIFLAITNTLIIPLTSTVCASAAVIYVQNFGRRRHYSMRHTATLADKGWSNPQVWLALLSIEGWRSQGSCFLAFAMGFHALGFLIGPLQQYYIGQEPFKFQTVSTFGFQEATDVYDLFRDGGPDVAFQTARLRNELASVSLNHFQPNIWQEVPPQCSSNSSNDFQVSPECNQGGTTFSNQGGITFSNLTTVRGPYIAQLPPGYNTGLITQFMPRMNSSASLSNVPRTAFPTECNATPEAYWIEYSYNTTLLNVQVCMLDGTYHSPWKANRDRQDATETMFLDIHFSSSNNQVTMSNNPANATFKITVNTTLGYFELPNHNNGGSPGPLLAKDPYETCPANKGQCASQLSQKRSLQINEDSTSLAIENTPNLGPLAMIVAAMFEPGSFIATQIPQKEITPSFMLIEPQAMPCIVPPLRLLFDDLDGPWCDDPPLDVDEGYLSIIQWLQSFYDISSMQNALHAAAILASQAWLSSVRGTLTVQYDMGQDSIRPKISSAGIILLSILLAIDLLLLLIVAIYINFSHTWAESFDSSAMMRLGAARADELPLQVSSSEVKEKTRAILERMPGWVGDARPDDEVGTMAIGATVPLKAGRRYQVS